MKRYLYILPFADNKHFKIGISDSIVNRVAKHHSSYKLNIKDSLIFKGDKRVINSLESSLLSITEGVDTFKGVDGHTEIRKISDLDCCLKLIDFYEQHNKISKVDYSKLVPQKEVKVIKKNSDTKEKLPLTNLTIDNMDRFVNKLFDLILEYKPEYIDCGYGRFNLMFEKSLKPLKCDNFLNEFSILATFYYDNHKSYGGIKIGATYYSATKDDSIIFETNFMIPTYNEIREMGALANLDMRWYKRYFEKIQNFLIRYAENY